MVVVVSKTYRLIFDLHLDALRKMKVVDHE